MDILLFIEMGCFNILWVSVYICMYIIFMYVLYVCCYDMYVFKNLFELF